MTTAPPHLSHPKYRSDIDGLRAVAVLSVVSFHAFPGLLRGGFIGVDVFFVISGFLISTIIFENLERGTFSFAEFYARRIRRIFPALLLVLIVSYAFGWFALLADEYRQFGKHLAAGAGFLSNFFLWNEAGYFDNSAETKPLLHLWSLGIEEQFYIAWPFLLWLAWKNRFNIHAVMIIVAIISFALNIKGVKHDPVATFYSPQTRFWELLCGSLLAWYFLYKKNVLLSLDTNYTALANALSVLGIGLLALGFIVIHAEFSFPGYWALLPVSGAVIIILAGPKAWANRTILSNRVLVWFGLISFPLYLWHWPLLSFARIVESGVPSRKIRIAAVLIAIFLAYLTYWVIERRMRRHGADRLKVSILSILMLFCLILGLVTYNQNGFVHRVEELNAVYAEQLSQIVLPPKLLRNENCERLFPNLKEGLCVASKSDSPSILLVGDSHAHQYHDGLTHFMPNTSIAMLGGGWGGRFRGALNPLLGSYTTNSDTNRKLQYDIYHILRTTSSIDTVIVSCSRQACYDNDPQYKEHLRETISHLLDINLKVIFVIDTPDFEFEPIHCLRRPFSLSGSYVTPCATARSLSDNRDASYLMDTTTILNEFANVIVFDPRDYLCDNAYCWMMKENRMLFRGGGKNPHLSDSGSLYLGEFLASQIEKSSIQ